MYSTNRTSQSLSRKPGRKHQLRSHRYVMPPSLHLSDSAAASVFRAVRLRGPVGRDVIAGSTSLSIATVNRQVIALLEAGLLRERADLAVSGAIGRPRVPVEVNHEPFVTLGIHIGARTRRLRIIPGIASRTRTGGSATAITDLLRVARAGNQQAKELLAERARVLGGAVALLRDLLNPDEVVVGGQAFTEYPEAMEQVEAAFTAGSVLAPRDIRVTVFGNRVQEAGAGIVSLSGLYADPLGALRRSGALDARLQDTAPEALA